MKMMKCGHAANAYTEDMKPCCAICIGLNPNAVIVDEEPIDLTGRIAICSQHKMGAGGGRAPSDTNLPFFEHRPNSEHDSYYCGCYGWN